MHRDNHDPARIMSKEGAYKAQKQKDWRWWQRRYQLPYEKR